MKFIEPPMQGKIRTAYKTSSMHFALNVNDAGFTCRETLLESAYRRFKKEKDPYLVIRIPDNAAYQTHRELAEAISMLEDILKVGVKSIFQQVILNNKYFDFEMTETNNLAIHLSSFWHNKLRFSFLSAFVKTACLHPFLTNWKISGLGKIEYLTRCKYFSETPLATTRFLNGHTNINVEYDPNRALRYQGWTYFFSNKKEEYINSVLL